MHDRDIFIALLQKDNPQDRKAYLSKVCGDNVEQRLRIEELLRSHDAAGDFLQRPAIESATTARSSQSHASVSQDAWAEVHDTAIQTDEDVSLHFLEPSQEPGSLGRIHHYVVHEVIGRGGFGIVLKALDPRLNRIVAVKVLAPELAANPVARQRFLREGQAAAAVNHPHVVTIHAVDDGEIPFLVMEYVDGISLQEKLDRSGALELREILRIGLQVAAGLAAAHSQGLIHRDVKPANVLLENGVERVKLTDFGLARAANDVGMTQTGVIAGTPQYMSPEQAQGQFVDQQSDLFSLGSLLYAMCTGRAPFRAESTIAVVRRVCDDVPRPIEQLNPDIPPWLIAVVNRLLEKRAEDRFQTSQEVADLLGSYLAQLQNPSHVLVTDAEPDPSWSERSTPDNGEFWLKTQERPQYSPMLDLISRLQGVPWTAWIAAILLVAALGIGESTGLTDFRGYLADVFQIQTSEGTLIVQVDDPEVSVAIGGDDLAITNAGTGEIRLKVGTYQLTARDHGRIVDRRLVEIRRGKRQVISISSEVSERPPPTPMPPPRMERIALLTGQPGHVRSVAFSPDGRRLVAVGENAKICLWDVAEQRLTASWQAHDGWINCVAVSPDGQQLATACLDGTVKLWDVEQQEEICTFRGHRSRVLSVAFSPDGQTVASGGDDGTVRLWDTSLHRQRDVLEHGDWVEAVAFTPDGRQLASTGGNRRVKIWNVRNGEPVQVHAANSNLYSIAFSPEGRLLAIGGAANQPILLRNGETGAIQDNLKFVSTLGDAAPAVVWDMAFSADGRWLAATVGSQQTDKGETFLFDMERGVEVTKLNGQTTLFWSVAFHPQKNLFALGSSDGTVAVWKISPKSGSDSPAGGKLRSPGRRTSTYGQITPDNSKSFR